MRRVTTAQMKGIDRLAQKRFGIPGLILMEHAGAAAAKEALRLLGTRRKKSACLFCGPGNNGGDGFVTGRHLAQTGMPVKIFLLSDPRQLAGDARINFDIIRRLNIPWRCCRTEKDWRGAERDARRAGLIIDAIFGIGLNKPVTGVYQRAIAMINRSKVPVLALDTPSGLCATTGRIWGVCVAAAHTVTFGLAKRGFFVRYGPAHTGTIVIADIGLPRVLLSARGWIKKACK